MSRPPNGEQAVADMIRAYMVLLPLMPLLQQAAEAEAEAPGYGAEAVMFRELGKLAPRDL